MKIIFVLLRRKKKQNGLNQILVRSFYYVRSFFMLSSDLTKRRFLNFPFKGHDKSTYKSGEISARRWIVEDNIPVYNKGRERSIMASDFLVMHDCGPFFSSNCKEFKEALDKYPDLNNDSDVIYGK